MMRIYILFCLLGAICHGTPLLAQCPAGNRALRLEIDPDQFYGEISWSITDFDGLTVWHKGKLSFDSLHIFNYCLPAERCAVFRIRDEYGDGIKPDGSYRLYLDSVLVFENKDGGFGRGEDVFVGCPPGGYCNNALLADTGLLKPVVGPEAWYRFTPPENATYELSVCINTGAGDCAAKIWVYDRCKDILLTNNQTGAIFFADAGCPGGAAATLFLAKGRTYYFRIRQQCPQQVPPSLRYIGPVIGCTNPAACNYNPLATVSDTCYFPGNPACTDGPDLMLREDTLRNQLRLNFIANAQPCAVNEGCLRGSKDRDVLEFTTHIQNIGNRDYFIGPPPTDTSFHDPRFYWDVCHQHWHFRGYAEYMLFDAVGRRIPAGSKIGFCVFDRECNNGGFGKFSCQNMGISAGCGDFYERNLPCQSVDITGLPAGQYTLAVRVNWTQLPDAAGRVERTYENNWAQACFTLNYGKDGKPGLGLLSKACTPFTDCKGVRYGSAEPDCAGNCNGPARFGDLNKDGKQDQADILAYLDLAQAGKNNVSTCHDLFADGKTDVYDAALLQECLQYPAQHNHWALRFPCRFPAGSEAQTDQVRLQVGAIDSVQKTVDILLINPNNTVIGYDFFVKGLDITKVENLIPSFGGQLRVGPEGKILALSTAEKPIPKNKTAVPFLRVHYAALKGPSVCIPSGVTIVNGLYQKSATQILGPRCRFNIPGQSRPGPIGYDIVVSPNPFSERTTVYFDNPEAEPVSVELSDMAGRVLQFFPGVESDFIQLERENLPPGLYCCSVSSRSRGRVTALVAVF